MTNDLHIVYFAAPTWRSTEQLPSPTLVQYFSSLSSSAADLDRFVNKGFAQNRESWKRMQLKFFWTKKCWQVKLVFCWCYVCGELSCLLNPHWGGCKRVRCSGSIWWYYVCCVLRGTNMGLQRRVGTILSVHDVGIHIRIYIIYTHTLYTHNKKIRNSKKATSWPSLCRRGRGNYDQAYL